MRRRRRRRTPGITAILQKRSPDGRPRRPLSTSAARPALEPSALGGMRETSRVTGPDLRPRSAGTPCPDPCRRGPDRGGARAEDEAGAADRRPGQPAHEPAPQLRRDSDRAVRRLGGAAGHRDRAGSRGSRVSGRARGVALAAVGARRRVQAALARLSGDERCIGPAGGRLLARLTGRSAGLPHSPFGRTTTSTSQSSTWRRRNIWSTDLR